MKNAFKVLLVILSAVAVVAAIVAVGRCLSRLPWAQTEAFQESAIIVYLVTLMLRLIFSWPKVRDSEKSWVKKATKAADAIHWIAAVLYAAVLFN